MKFDEFTLLKTFLSPSFLQIYTRKHTYKIIYIPSHVMIFEDHRDHKNVGRYCERHHWHIEDDQQVVSLSVEFFIEIPQYVGHEIHFHYSAVVRDRRGWHIVTRDLNSRCRGHLRRRCRCRRRNTDRVHPHRCGLFSLGSKALMDREEGEFTGLLILLLGYVSGKVFQQAYEISRSSGCVLNQQRKGERARRLHGTAIIVARGCNRAASCINKEKVARYIKASFYFITLLFISSCRQRNSISQKTRVRPNDSYCTTYFEIEIILPTMNLILLFSFSRGFLVHFIEGEIFKFRFDCL